MRNVRETTLKEFFQNLGLSEEEIKICLTLGQYGTLSILELSRKSGINRTRAYRLVDSLNKKGITDEIIDTHSRKIKLVDPHSLDLHIRSHEEKSYSLRNKFPLVLNLLTSASAAFQPGTKVLFYRGKEGVRQQVWNTLRTEKTCLGFTYRNLDEIIGGYYLKWFEEFVKRNLLFRDIYSDSYLESLKPLSKSGEICYPENFISRYVPSDVLDINHQVDIYNDVTSYYNWFEGEIFGVEIYNDKIAAMQKQMFEIIWKISKPPEK
jgi:DNA-binding MarR family transcriptional regulator